MNPNTAKALRQNRRTLGDDYGKFGEDNDDDFIKNAGETIKKSEEEQKVKKIQNQINYFGYMIEPLNMKNEREEKEIDEQGNYRFSWKKEKENSDAWLSQLDEDQYGFKMYFNAKNEKGVFSDEDDDRNSDDEEEINKRKKKIKRNDENSKGKFDDMELLDLLKELNQILEEGQKEIDDIMIVITPRLRMQQINDKLKKNEKPVFPFKKNMRQKDKEEQEKKLKEWEASKLSDQEEHRVKNILNDLMDIIKELEYKLQTATFWETDLDKFKEMLQKEEAKQVKTRTGGNDEENMAEEDDLKLIPKQLLDKLNAGTLTEEEEDEVRRFIMIARMRRSKDEDSDEEEIRTGNIQFDSDSDDEEEGQARPQQPISRVPISQQNQQQQQFKAPAPIRRNSQPEENNQSNQIRSVPGVSMPPPNRPVFQRPDFNKNAPIEEEEEIPVSKPLPNQNQPKPSKAAQDDDDDVDMFN